MLLGPRDCQVVPLGCPLYKASCDAMIIGRCAADLVVVGPQINVLQERVLFSFLRIGSQGLRLKRRHQAQSLKRSHHDPPEFWHA